MHCWTLFTYKTFLYKSTSKVSLEVSSITQEVLCDTGDFGIGPKSSKYRDITDTNTDAGTFNLLR